jgi:hypothetical protein
VPLLDNVQGVEGVEIETLLGDMAYSDGDIREAVERRGADMVAKVPPIFNSGRFPKTAFFIEPDRITCPARGRNHRCPSHPGRQWTPRRPLRVPRRRL